MQNSMITSAAVHRSPVLVSILETVVKWIYARQALRRRSVTENELSRPKDAYYSQEELEEIVIRYKDLVYRLAVMRMKSQSSADDIFQETFMRLVRQNKRFESEEMLKAWLIRVTINCCNDHYRSAWSRRIVPFRDDRKKGEADDGNEEYEYESAAGEYDPFESDNPLAEATYDAVLALPDQFRTVIHMFYYENMSVKEIAEALGARENAVKTRLSRARNALRDKLEGLYRG